MNAGCLDEGRVLAFVEGTISDDRRAELEAHIAVCGACSDLTTWAAAEHAQRSRVPGDEGRPFIGPLAPGARVARYQILGAVGRGGMGEVYAAYHPDLDRRIALKVVGQAGARAPERRARLLREARAIARLSHPNVITVHDAGTVDDRVYIAMEFVEGHTIDQWLRAQARDWREILDVFVAAARGLAAAHAAGVVHRDFKPQNVMIGRDGSVRVMDFGLARLAEEPIDAPDAGDALEARPVPQTVTRTGALVGTLAYMSPEQFKGDPLDARADQFSFCVAFHEALYGSRPALAHIPGAPRGPAALPARAAGVPAWLRAVVGRGLAADREKRFPSMDELIGALARGRARPRRRALGASVVLAIALLAAGGWRAARGGRINCEAPADRLAAAWSGRDDARRRSIQHAFTSTRRPNAEISWRRVSQLLDGYIGAWSAMYVETCEATHVRGEQSGDVLDLRMACLGENLDEVRALTDMLVHADDVAVGHSPTAAEGLTAVRRCADLALLRSAVPLPRNAETRAKVQTYRAAFRDVRSLIDLGSMEAAARTAAALRPEIEAVGYKPLLGELLVLMGMGFAQQDPARAEGLLESAFLTGEACRDDQTAATAATSLTYVVGFLLQRPAEGTRWAQIAGAILDRMGSGHERLRGWLATDYGTVLVASGNLKDGLALFEQAVTLKERALGPDHPDVAISLSNLSLTRTRAGLFDAALDAADRALRIRNKRGDADAPLLAALRANRGDVLAALGRQVEAETEFTAALKLLAPTPDAYHEDRSQALHGLGALRLAEGQVAAAIPLLEQALNHPAGAEIDKVLTANTRFALARALWQGGGDRRRARSLAVAARDGYARQHRTESEQAVEAWLAGHRAAPR